MSTDSLTANVDSNRAKFDFKTYSTLMALMLLFIILALVTQGDFIDPRNFTNLTRQISVNGILAVGMTLVILTAGIDLSVGSVVALSGIVGGMLQVHLGLSEWGIPGTALSIFACSLAGLVLGVINGGLISYFKIPPFVITLGMMVIARGLALIFSDSSAISPMSDSFKWIAKGFLMKEVTFVLFSAVAVYWAVTLAKRWKKKSKDQLSFFLEMILEGVCFGFAFYCFMSDRGLPIPTLILFSFAGVGIFVLQKLPLGRYIYAIGGNEEASHLSGIPVKKVKWTVYAFMGFLAGTCGALLAARLNSAAPTEGQLMELDAIAAVVIGGTSLMGGLGTIGGSLIGAFLIGTLNNGMDILEVDSNYQMVIKGIIIIFAVWFDARQKQKATK